MSKPAITFNHVMIYTSDLARSLRFYEQGLGFEMVDSYPGAYARLKSPAGSTTIALHVLDKGQQMQPATEGVRLYFEVKELEALCDALQRDGVALDQPPKRMPWGWTHAYLRDPDGHEISLYRAGEARLGRTVMSDEAD